MTSENSPSSRGDHRGRSLGLGRLLIVVLWCFAASTLAAALWGLARATAVPLGLRLVGVLAGLLYVLAAIGVMHNGRRMRIMAWACLTVSLSGPIIIGLVGIGALSEVAGPYSAWANFGADLCFLPLIIPAVMLGWMWYSDPRRIVVIAEGVARK